ncbi:MAG: ABC transporter ATP-binding protein [Lachnospiraceae bacterium]|nr:ABC transporter ATP-binding protein [Lachnospiraceae bacterium]
MIKFNDVSKTFDGGVKAVDHVSFDVQPGEIVGFIGPNGSGKTTSMKMMTGILKPDTGNIEIGGYDITTNPLEAKQLIGYISDSPDQFMRLIGREYLDFIADIYGVSLEDRVKRADALSERFGMADALDRQIVSYSHGMRQKIMVIGALIHEPDEWILDEPMTGLDPESAFELKKMMREHADKGHAVLFSTHVLEVAEKLCDRVVIIRYGKVLFSGTLDELTALYPDTSLEEIFIEMMKDKEGADESL